ncbi:MAG: DNA oxidative demethylase AlkB [Methylovulum sp.]|nr:DNA oxidative demethylase AlkB [Methylovulum sp.]
MNYDLFDDLPGHTQRLCLQEGAVLLRGFAISAIGNLLAELEKIIIAAPFRHMLTPGAHQMSVAMSNCGQVGWVSDRNGYRYAAIDPETGRAWPEMPAVFLELAQNAAAQAGFAKFLPDACLINCYVPGAKLSLHQDKDERDASAPIVSVSLGLPAVFLFGGQKRTDRPQRYRLVHGDVVVWGGAARFNFHGVAPLADGTHPLLGRRRINLTYRKTV